MKSLLKKMALDVGLDISRYDPRFDPKAVLRSLFARHNINLVFDVGANSGQYGRQLRENNFSGTIISFEPLSSAFNQLQEASSKDQNWTALNYALGETAEKLEINIAGNSWSSSLLEMLPSHVNEAPESGYVATEEVEVVTLDSLFTDYVSDTDKPFLKIDTQGYTLQVLNGAKDSISRISGAMVEMSFVPLYENEPLVGDIIQLMYEYGFVLVYVEPEFVNNETGQQLQANGYFFRQ